MKVLCPYHNDTNPSMEVYPDGHRYCFVCTKTDWLADKADSASIPVKEAEDLKVSIEEISTFPLSSFRGLELPKSFRGHYIVWPNNLYYKIRTNMDKPKYIAPTGHTPPLLWANNGTFSDTLIIVEGEINALSVAKAMPSCHVVSPGSATNFEAKLEELLQVSAEYANVAVWADHDGPGIKAVWSIIPDLYDRGINVCEITLTTDANDILVNYGVEAIKQVISEAFQGEVRV